MLDREELLLLVLIPGVDNSLKGSAWVNSKRKILKEDYDIDLLACMALTLLLLMSTACPRSVVPAGVICRMFTDVGQ